MKHRNLLKTMLLLCALMVGSSNVWATDVDFAPSDFSGQGTSGTGSAISSTKSTVTFACDKGYGTTQIRCYKEGTITISSTNTITAISFTFSGSYNGGLETSYTELSTTSWTQKLGSQARITAVTVTYSGGSDPSSDVAFEYEARSLDLKDASSFTQTATTADGYEDEDGSSVTYSMTANTAGASINASTGEVTPTKAGSVTVQAAAAEIVGKFSATYASYTLTVTDNREWDVTCHIGNNTIVETRTSGATLSLDDPAAICGMSFVGWSSTDDVSDPDWVSNSTTVLGNMELYAMFEYKAGEYSYRLVESSQADWRGDYLIAYSATVFASGKVNGTTGIGSASTVQDPDDNLSDKVVDATWGDEYYVTLEAIDEADLSKGYVLKTQDGYYNYHTNNTANGINGTSKTKATAAGYPISINYVNSGEINITLDKGQVFRFNSSEGYFRYYKSTSYSGMGKVYLYKRTEDVAPVYSLGLTESITVGSDGYATYASTNPLDFTEAAIYAYIAKADGRTGVTFERIKKVPANTGVLLYKEGGTTESILKFDGTGADATTGNVFVPGTGDPVASVSGDLHNYILNKPTAKPIGFYKAAGQTVAANKAYIQIDYSVVAGIKEFFILPGMEDDATSIQNSKFEIQNEEAPIYNLAGQRISKMQKGINIVNGKKIMVK